MEVEINTEVEALAATLEAMSTEESAEVMGVLSQVRLFRHRSDNAKQAILKLQHLINAIVPVVGLEVEDETEGRPITIAEARKRVRRKPEKREP